MRARWKQILGCACLSLSAACGDGNAPPEGQVVLSPQAHFTLPGYHYTGASTQVEQWLVATYQDQKFLLQAHLQLARDHLLLIGMDALGRRAFTLRWDATGTHYDAADWVPAALKPENILGDLFLIYWPAPDVRHAISPTAGALRTAAQTRELRWGDSPVVSIAYTPRATGWNGQAHYRNLVWGYQLDIQSHEVAHGR